MPSRGRPTLVGQREIEKILHEYFLKGYSESGTTAITGIGKNTVSKYFKKWHEELLSQENQEYRYGLNDLRLRLGMSFDMMLYELYKIKDEMNQELEDYKSENDGKIPHGKGMYKERIKIVEAIITIIDSAHGLRFQRNENEIYDSVKVELETKYEMEQKHQEELRKNRLEERQKRLNSSHKMHL